MPTFVLCMSTRARRSLLERLPRKSLTNLLAYLRLSPQPPHCHALRFSRSGASSQVQRSIRPALQALANAWVRPAEEMAYKKAVSLNPGKAHLECEVMSRFLSFPKSVKKQQTSYLSLIYWLGGAPLRCSSTSRSGIDIGILGRSWWWPLSESPPHPGLVCTSCAASFPVWAGHKACSGPCPRSPLVESSMAG